MTRSHYHHVAIYDGNGMVIESMPGGVRSYKLGQRNITGIRPNTPVEQRIAAADWARSHIGDAYDTRGLALIALDRILPGLRLEILPRQDIAAPCLLRICICTAV